MADAWLLSSEGKDGILPFLAQKRDLAQKRQSYLISVITVLVAQKFEIAQKRHVSTRTRRCSVPSNSAKQMAQNCH